MSDPTLSISNGSFFSTTPVSNTVYTSPGSTNDTVVLSGGSLTNIGLNTGAGNDSLTISTILTADRTGPKDQWSIILGSGDDIGVINSAISGYNLQAGVGNDTLVINGVATNTVVSGGKGSDALFIKNTFTGGQIAATGPKVGGPFAAQINDGADTIVIANGVTVENALINQFSITSTTVSDTLIIGGTFSGDAYLSGGTVITASDFAEAGAVAGTYGKFALIANSGNNADITILNDWLAGGSLGNRITLI